jgi:hypothetical protein
MKNGGKYYGELNREHFHGFGRQVTADGQSYSGEFAKGKREGYAELVLRNHKGAYRYIGNFTN